MEKRGPHEGRRGLAPRPDEKPRNPYEDKTMKQNNETRKGTKMNYGHMKGRTITEQRSDGDAPGAIVTKVVHQQNGQIRLHCLSRYGYGFMLNGTPEQIEKWAN